MVVTRVGIHLGEIVVRKNSDEDVARGANAVEVEGLAKAFTARLMALARRQADAAVTQRHRRGPTRHRRAGVG